VGPVSEDEIRQNLQNGTIDASTLLFAEGMTNWTPLQQVPEFASASSPRAIAPPPVPGGRRAHEIDSTIYGEDLQFVEVALDPGEPAHHATHQLPRLPSTPLQQPLPAR
jgi:hypothetical protein